MLLNGDDRVLTGHDSGSHAFSEAEVYAGVEAGLGHVINEAAVAVIGLIVSVSEFGGDRFGELVSDGGLEVPCEVGADTEAADVTFSGEEPFVVDVPLGAGSDDGIRPGLVGGHAGGQALLELRIDRTGEIVFRILHACLGLGDFVLQGCVHGGAKLGDFELGGGACEFESLGFNSAGDAVACDGS